MAAANNPLPGRNVWDFLSALLGLVSNLIQAEMGSQQATLARIEKKQADLSKQVQELATMQQKEFTDVIDKLDNATSKGATVAAAISDQLTKLRTEVQGMGLSTEDAQAVLTRLTASGAAADLLAQSLDAMAKDPTNPVPVPVPDPPPPGPPPAA